jgi:hypothetical protein
VAPYVGEMKVSAALIQDGDLWLAQCEELDRTGEGSTPAEAIDSLRQALKEYFDVEAVAPPPKEATAPIEIVIIDAPKDVPLPRSIAG